VTAFDELEKRLEGPGLIVALTKDEARDLLSAAREGEKLREALTEMFDAYGPWTGKTCKQERADDAARAALHSETPHVK
jgi:hypothetical protein